MSRSRSQKAPLKIVESSNQGEVHQYGSPVFKSLNPTTVKKMSSRTNNKWISPDPHFKSSSNSNTKTLRSSNQENTRVQPKKATTLPNHSTEAAPMKKVIYKKLDFVKDSKSPSSGYESDDNKENISPGSEAPTKPALNKKSISKSRNTQFSGRSSNRLNRI